MSLWNPSDQFKEDIRTDAVRTFARVVNPDVGVVSILLKNDGSRISYKIINVSNFIARLTFNNQDNISSYGLQLDANGGTLEVSLWEDGPLVNEQVFVYIDDIVQLYIIEQQRIFVGGPGALD